MRLLEPMQGLKVAANHYAIHLTFFIAIFFVNQDPNYLYPAYAGKKATSNKDASASKHRLLTINDHSNNTARHLAGSSYNENDESNTQFTTQ